MPSLSASAYVVLGLLRDWGPATPYALDRTIRQSIGHFWLFPRSQLYAEAARLVRLGLVEEAQEDTGRRRRLLSLSPAGRTEFQTWLASPTQAPTEIRDAGLLRLFFHAPGGAGAADVQELAVEQAKAHRRKLTEYERIAAAAPFMSPAAPQAAALELGLRFERMAIGYWDEIAANGAGAVTAEWGTPSRPAWPGDRHGRSRDSAPKG